MTSTRSLRSRWRALTLGARRTFGRTRWAIAIYAGADPLSLAPRAGAGPVLTRDSVTDVLATFVADPFMLRVDGTWHMFFEVLACSRAARKGVIAHATSHDALRWEYRRVVLEEPFHLSYPQVFVAGGDIYMIPESQEGGGVRLYRADPFPSRWTYVGDLLTGPVFYDSTVFQHGGRWWMFTETGGVDTLRLFGAEALGGPWREHPMSPIVQGDPRRSRPAGRIASPDGRLLRLAQDCVPDYGTGVRAFEVTRLSPSEYAERPVAEDRVLGPGAERWNRRGMHQIDAHRLDDGTWIACVDGWTRALATPAELVRELPLPTRRDRGRP